VPSVVVLMHVAGLLMHLAYLYRFTTRVQAIKSAYGRGEVNADYHRQVVKPRGVHAPACALKRRFFRIKDRH
jgi:hypothetical protein